MRNGQTCGKKNKSERMEKGGGRNERGEEGPGRGGWTRDPINCDGGQKMRGGCVHVTSRRLPSSPFSPGQAVIA